MKLVLGTASHSKKGKCFFCGADVSFEPGEKICSLDVGRKDFDSELGRHMCSTCARLSDGKLHDKVNHRIEKLRDLAETYSDRAQELQEKTDDEQFDRVWHPSAME